MGRMVTDVIEENARSCDCVVLTCCDYRIWEEELRVHLARAHDARLRYDLLAVPGAIHRLVHGPEHKGLSLLEDLDLLISVHNPETVVVIPHMHCAVYHAARRFRDEEDERETLVGDIAQAQEVLLARFPRVRVQGYIAEIDLPQARLSRISRTRFSVPPPPHAGRTVGDVDGR